MVFVVVVVVCVAVMSVESGGGSFFFLLPFTSAITFARCLWLLSYVLWMDVVWLSL